jgi:hypothetical protein
MASSISVIDNGHALSIRRMNRTNGLPRSASKMLFRGTLLEWLSRFGTGITHPGNI